MTSSGMDFFGKYKVLEKVGEGGFGTLYRGYDPFIQREVAIKTCTSDDQDVRDRFFQEAQIAGNLQHRNITVVYDFGIENGVPYLVQEFLSGEDLHRKIKRGDELPFGTRLLYLIQIVRGLNQAHQKGVVHRDIKPNNVRILEDGTVKIMDFGIAKLHAMHRTLTETGETIGTAAYLSPEQIRGEAVDPRADIFSFGVLAYELMTGQRAFQGDNPSTVLYSVLSREPPPIATLWPACPEEMQRIVNRCLKKDREDRYETCADLLTDLSQMLDGPEQQAAEGVIAAPSGRIQQLIADRDLHSRDTVSMDPPSLSGVELRPQIEDSCFLPTESKLGDTTTRRGPSALGLLMLLLAVTGLGTGAWWYVQGFRPIWASAPGDRPPSPNLKAPITETADRTTPNPVPPIAPDSVGKDGVRVGRDGVRVGRDEVRNAQVTALGFEQAPDPGDANSEQNLATTDPDLTRADPPIDLPEVASPGPSSPSTQPSSGARGVLAEALLTLRQLPGSERAFLVLDDVVLGWTPIEDLAMAPGRYRLEVFTDPSDNQPRLTETVELSSGSAHVLTIDLGRTLLHSHQRVLSEEPVPSQSNDTSR